MKIHSSSLNLSAASLIRRQAAEFTASREAKANELLPIQKVQPQNQNSSNQNNDPNQQPSSNKSLVPAARSQTYQPTDLRTIKALNSYSQENRRPIQNFDITEATASIDTYA